MTRFDRRGGVAQWPGSQAIDRMAAGRAALLADALEGWRDDPDAGGDADLGRLRTQI